MKSMATNLMRLFGWNTQGDFGPLTMYTASDRGLVAFLKAPPRCPATPNQIITRARFIAIGKSWRTLTLAQKKDWERATRVACLRCTGYDLFTYYHMKQDRGAVATIEQQTGIPLYCPPFIPL